MTFYSGSGDRLSSNLALVIENYEVDREAYWDDGGVNKILLELVDRYAKHLVAASLQAFDETGSSARLLSALDEPEVGALSERIEIDLAQDAVDRLPEGTERCLRLARWVVAAQPNERVVRFLNRLGRSYVFGFGPECVILCRAVIEAAVEDTLEARGEAVQGNLSRKLAHAREKGLLQADAFREANQIRIRGNKAVHDDPTVTTDIDGTLQSTMLVLKQLYEAAE